MRYWFDNLMARGTPALIGMLFVASLLVVMVAGGVVSLAGFVQDGESGRLGFGEAVWQSLMRTLDSGTMGGDTGAGYRGVMLLVTLGGIFIVSALIGVLNNGIEGQMDALRKGRSIVLENNHTLILGWSAQVFTILNELMAANENQRNACLVVLADKDKVEMEDEIRERVTQRGRTRIICRSGRPIDPGDLEIANPQGSKAIIILPPEGEDPDTEVIKTVVAITKNANRRPEPYHIATQVRYAKNLSVLRMVCAQDRLQVVQTGDLIARIVAQTSRQSGLSVVYTELMDFGGDEIYFKAEPGLVGKTYGESLLAYEDSSVMGLRKSDGRILLNPAMDTRIEGGDQVFAISQDDDTIKLGGTAAAAVEPGAIRSGAKAPGPQPAKCLILGWNQNGATIVRELDNYVAPGSQATVVADIEDSDAQVIQAAALTNQKLTVQQGDTADRDLLDALKVEDFDHVIVLAYNLPPQEADAKTLVTLLHLRDISERDQTPFSIVSEMLDLRNRELAQATQVDDFIVSEQLVSLMMAQFSENAELYDVFTDIFDPEGSEIYLKPVNGYVATGQPVTFATVVEAARQRGETAIGYRLAAQATDASRSYGVHTNPPKTEAVTFSESDKVVVVAEG
jgi:voltage-gated potassium channel Kch